MRYINKLNDKVEKLFNYATPVADFLIRVWIANLFWQAGISKIAHLESTAWLFTYVYHVPLLNPTAAAYLFTGIELILPIFLAVGLFTRISASLLFIYNIIGLFSYPAISPTWLQWHIVWSLLLLVPMCHGAGLFSLDQLLKQRKGKSSNLKKKN